MSTFAYPRRLYGVPDPRPTISARHPSLIEVREVTRRAFARIACIPRSAVNRVMSLIHQWPNATGRGGGFAWLPRLARNAVGLTRAVGVVPVLFAVLSTPPVATAAARAARFISDALLRLTTSTWASVKDWLTRCGSAGTQVAEGLETVGAMVASSFRAAAQHPIVITVLQSSRATWALVRPVSQGLVTHRLLLALVPIPWLRLVIECLVILLVVDPTLVGKLRDRVQTPPATSNGTKATPEGLLIDAFGSPITTNIPKPSNGSRPTDGSTIEQDQPLNRAERRAQQRQDAQAKRNHHPHS
jgi:hypothetical protein